MTMNNEKQTYMYSNNASTTEFSYEWILRKTAKEKTWLYAENYKYFKNMYMYLFL
jgi:hypothetical protein